MPRSACVLAAAVLASLAGAPRRATLGEKKPFRATLAGLSGLDRSRDVVLKLSALFALDSFGGGFVVQSFAAYWFYLRFGVDPGDARRDLLLGEHLRRHLGAARRRGWRRASA